MSKEKVTVEIIGYERVEYRQQVEMTKAEYERLKAIYEDEGMDEEEAAEQILEFVDRGDVCGADNPEVFDFKLVK